MVLRYNDTLRNTRLQDVANDVDGGVAAGLLRGYGGGSGQPVGGAPITDQTLLFEITLNDPAFEAPAAGVMAPDVTPEPQDPSANASGTLQWCRVVRSDGTYVMDGVAGVGSGDFQFATLAIVAAAVVRLTGGSGITAGNNSTA